MKPGDLGFQKAVEAFLLTTSCKECPRSISGGRCGDPGFKRDPWDGCVRGYCPNNDNGRCTHPLHPANITLEELVLEEL
jgi:hypothetical protein